MGGNSGRKKTPSAWLFSGTGLLLKKSREKRENVPYFKKLVKALHLEATAHHEAGHAVAALYHGLKFTYVTIIPDEQQGSLGHVKFRGVDKSICERFEFGALTDRRRMDIERHVITMLTAGAAEARFRGRRDYVGAGKDREDAAELARSWRAGADLVLLKKYLDYTQEVAMCFVADNRNWKNICAVAAALLAHPCHRLSQREVRAVLYGQPTIVSETRRFTIPSL